MNSYHALELAKRYQSRQLNSNNVEHCVQENLKHFAKIFMFSGVENNKVLRLITEQQATLLLLINFSLSHTDVTCSHIYFMNGLPDLC